MNKRYVSPLILLLCLVVVPAQAQQTGFGGALAIGDDVVFISETSNTVSAGSVFVYEHDAASGDWVLTNTLSASDATEWDDRFGRALTTDGQTLIVGATKGSGSTKGTTYFFEKDDTGNWTETARITASDAADEFYFGRVLAISGDVAMITSLGHSESAGAVYVFQRDPATGSWSEHSILKGSDVQAGEYFGMSLALEGHTALIAAPPKDEGAGAVYTFEYDAASDAWSETSRLEVEGLAQGNQFGAALSLRDGVALVGAPRIDGNLGAVYVFERDEESGEWTQQNKLVPFDGEQVRLGASLAFDGTHAWIGAPAADGFQGAVYLYERNADTGAWEGATKLTGEEIGRGDFFAGALAMRGDLAVVGVLGADYGTGTAIIFEQEGGSWMEKNTVLNDAGGLASIVGGKVNCTDGEADIFGCSQVDLLSFLSVRDLGGGRGVRTNDLWGWTDPETDKEYALVGRIDATAFVDISDPYNPVHLGDLPRTEGSPGSTWRDIKVYNDHAFIVADGAAQHGMQVFDLTQLRDVENPPVTFEETAHYDGIASAHNIVINEDTGFAYAVGTNGGGETCGGGLHMIDIRQPAEPVFAGCFSDTETGNQGTGYSHDAQCVIYNGPDIEHQGKEICFGSNETALSIADVTDKENPIALSNASYPNVAYSHQGWLTEDHRYFYMNDEGDEIQGVVDGTRTLVWDVQDLDDPQLVNQHISENKASDHNLYIRGNLMYQSNYQSGLRILDISDAVNPVEVGFFDTVPYGEDVPSMGGSWSNYPYFQSGVIVVTSGYEGMFILKKKDIDI